MDTRNVTALDSGTPHTATTKGNVAWLEHFPVALFATVMGMAGLAIAWLKALHVLGAPAVVAEALRWLATAVWLTLLIVYLTKLRRFPGAVRAELAHPVKLNFFAAISIGLLLLAIAWSVPSPGLSRWMWIAGAAAQLSFTLLALNTWLYRGEFQIQQLTPAWFIPIVGNIIVPIAGVHYAPADVSWFFMSIGLTFWLVLLTLVFYRLIFHGALAPKLEPMLFILIAPPAVGFLAYLALNGNELDVLSRVLYFLALFLTLLLAVHVRRFLRLPFFLTAWAYSFPLAAMTIATLEMAIRSGLPFYRVLGAVLLVVVSALVAVLFVKTLHAMKQGIVFVPE